MQSGVVAQFDVALNQHSQTDLRQCLVGNAYRFCLHHILQDKFRGVLMTAFMTPPPHDAGHSCSAQLA